ncbi:MAG: hypothetical protein DMD59_12405 [Gemmatimonadetes bacterium]|nr:MAG: hypothetical protein DMD59_12405 [Gemmatimonadota bacterium]
MNTLRSRTQKGTVRWPWIALLILGTVAVPRGSARGQSVAGRGVAARLNTPATGIQLFARAVLPAGGGMVQAELDTAGAANMLGAAGLTSIVTGQVDPALVSVTATAEAADVDILNGLITAKSVLALATSYANGTSAWSEADGSTLLSLVIAGIAYPDGAPAPNTRVELPGVGYAVLNEQIARGDGLQSAGLTVNMIHVYLLDPVSGAAAGEIVVGAATSTATL